MTRHVLALALATTAMSVACPARADTARDRMPQIYTMTPTGVNLQSGTFVHSETDFTIGALSFVRAWRSVPSVQLGTASGLDHHRFAAWNHNFGFGARWHPTRTNGAEIYADGKVYQFVRQQDLSWMPWNIDQHNNNAFGAQLTGAIDSNLVFRNQNGDVYTFDSSNRATRVDYADGTRIDLVHDSSGRLDTILSSRGDAIVLDYNANGLIAAACGFNRALVFVDVNRTCSQAGNLPQVKVSYGYTSTTAAQGWNLTGVTGADGQVTQMTYDTHFRPNLSCIMPPGLGTCRITNVYGPVGQNVDYLPDQVRQQTTATGEVYNYEYLNMTEYAEWPPIEYGEIRLTFSTMTGPLSERVHAEYENGFLKRLTTNQGFTQYSWAGLRPTHFTSPGGNVELLDYDLRGNLWSRTRRAVAGSGDADIASSATFPISVPGSYPTGCDATSQRLCSKPITTTDERGNVTDYTYDPAHGGALTVTRPAAPVRQANGTIVNVRPQTRYNYQQLYAGVRNSAGQIVNAVSPVWVLTQESECRTTSSCAGTADEVRTVYEYGPSGSANALRLRGRTVTDNVTSVRTCFTYDAAGNRISETGPGGAPPTCPAQ